MFNINDKVVYKRYVCNICDILFDTSLKKQVYVLKPVYDNSLTIKLPIDLGNKLIRNIGTLDEINNVILNIPNIDLIETSNIKNIENEYKYCLENPTYYNLIKVIKTTYIRNKERIDSKKKISDIDDKYFKNAEKLLYEEFSLVLGLNVKETKEYIISKVLNM